VAERIRARRFGEIVDAEAWPCGVPGLVIANAGSGLEIIHTRSGTCVGKFGDADPEAVLAAAQGIGCLADWTLPGTELRHEPGLGLAVEEVLNRWDGSARGAPNPPSPVDLSATAVSP
jgi:hypothetical protein